MKKYLYSALALPLLFACSSEDFTEQEVISNDQFAGIEKVDATFTMDEGFTRFDGGIWKTEEGDLWGFAWMGDGTVIAGDGKAYQNHNLIQTDGIFTPQTSIYVGKYYIYRPYDKTTVSPQAINFKSLEEQPLTEGYASHSNDNTPSAWKNLAKTAINIGDKWTNVTTTGTTDASGKVWNKAGIKEHYDIYAALFSNQTGLDLTYKKNNPTFTAAKRVQGATDIDYTYAAGTAVGAADIFDVTVDLAGSAKSFTYAPTAEPNSGTHSGAYWADKENLGAGDGFTFTAGAITLKAADQTNGLSTGDNGSKGWFWFNSLPVTAGNATTATAVQTVFNTSYGVVTVDKTVADAYEWHDFGTASSHDYQWVKLADATDEAKTPKEWDVANKNTFVNQYGNHTGKYTFDVDFSTGVMNGMHIKSDVHLQKLLKYYIASGKSENVTLNLDQAGTGANNVFKISKMSIALLQAINASSEKVKVQACTSHGTPKVIVTQEGQADLGLADKTEVPDLNKVFATSTDVYLASGTNWTWKDRTGANQLTIDANVKSLTNEGTLTVNATNLDLSVTGKTITNAKDATMKITKVTTVKTALTNLGTIKVGDTDNTAAELRAYGVDITNDATSLTASGTIENFGVVGVSAGTSGHFYNYGKIEMKNNDAITLLTSNEKGTTPFGTNFAAGTNMMGTVVLPEGNPTALVSVSNAAENGFIKYNWTAATYATPAGIVKYNTIVVSNDIKFTANAPEVQYIEFNGTRTQVVNPGAAGTNGYLTAPLKGIIINAGKSIIIEKTNTINCTVGAYLGTGATVYKGGAFTYPSGQETANYYSITGKTWSTDQIVEY
ncbi:MAG: hypothetical protein IJ671_08180 [Succinivibrio sp.]|nr:hypothetical protein [Succinivibrio sp.]